MSVELINEENVSVPLLRKVLDDAMITYSLDDDGDILIQEGCKMYLMVDKEKSRLWLLNQYRFEPGVPEERKHAIVNEINRNLVLVCTYVSGNQHDAIRFTHDINLEGGITRKALVKLVRRFAGIPNMAVMRFGDGMVK